ncbi:putative dna mismatch repair protein pms1 protein [Phaeoacremonium minimum UCRPA7]|uniref:Putative dna mismatch repair protein pms1 protein n=1 Tax=Phaeoacremonium minimum (strain UCR-PA7) TaxID=1286976 RepID=R8BQ69_PHAM7|nr:putative dna mismatch repair protein pms1 protein [Phaeoacremonium minimum UCRPA7]EOO01501.1 putative dna mismatch repair protein pms1 protein [Phaeoacremonium minimum UCRPA7]
MADTVTIKAIEAGTVHQIQSGQVIVDLCSVAKELVENSIDAGATSIEIRFKNQGLDSIEVQDNGGGIAPQNYESLALKHYTSKLSTYSDLDTLQTFGFRGEALSSLCALSRFSVVTCLQSDVPKGTRLEFETSGKLKGTSVIAAQKGTTVFVENLFHNLPVRRRELERNIKREWNKVMSLLNQYACIQTGVKFTVSQQPNKGKRIVLFSTKGNPTTRENIVNVFGAKTVGALITLDLKLELEPTTGQKWSVQVDDSTKEILVRGFVSRPAHGEGRQTPDRQMFFVNGRPCGLPQFAKVFNEVYRSYNSSQSPFIFADIQLDTHLYDVNVSPDKRTILLHEQNRMLDNLRDSLTELFEAQDYTVPTAQLFSAKQTPYKRLSLNREGTTASGSSRDSPVGIIRKGSSGVATEEDHSDLDPSEDEDEPATRSKKAQATRRSVSAKSLSKDTGALEPDDQSENAEQTNEQDNEDSNISMPDAEESENMFLSEPNDTSSDVEDKEMGFSPEQDENLRDDEQENDEEEEEEESEPSNSPQSKLSDDGDDAYLSEEENDEKTTLVLETTEVVEEGGVTPNEDIHKRSQQFLKGTGKRKDTTVQLMQRLKVNEESLREQVYTWEAQSVSTSSGGKSSDDSGGGLEAEDAEEKLSLSIAKADFGKMKIVGQFNLGFVLAVRARNSDGSTSDSQARDDDLFIIDQHASDEKYNFERLQASTVVQSQRLVKPKTLELTAVEEEILIENQPALEANGFVVSVDESGDEPVGSRCQLLSLPLSRETTFSLADLEELISLLGEHTSSNE